MDQHDLVSAVKNLALELGRSPTRREFASRVRGGEYQLNRLYGGFSALLQAAGLETYEERSGRNGKSLGREVFEVSVESRIESYKPAPIESPTVYTPTLVIGDVHFPFASQRVLDGIYEWALKHQPRRIVQIGDLYDMFSWSKFPKSMNVYVPQEEQDLGRKQADAMWAELQKVSKNAECVQLRGNHDVRPLRQTLANLPSLEHVISKYLDELLTFPGVKTIADERQEYVADGIAFIHGYKTGNGPHRDHMLMNACVGHSHLGGVTYRRVRGQTLFELNAGFVGDPESKAFSYTPQKIVNWTPGWGYIHEWGPQFVHFG